METSFRREELLFRLSEIRHHGRVVYAAVLMDPVKYGKGFTLGKAIKTVLYPSASTARETLRVLFTLCFAHAASARSGFRNLRSSPNYREFLQFHAVRSKKFPRIVV